MRAKERVLHILGGSSVTDKQSARVSAASFNLAQHGCVGCISHVQAYIKVQETTGFMSPVTLDTTRAARKTSFWPLKLLHTCQRLTALYILQAKDAFAFEVCRMLPPLLNCRCVFSSSCVCFPLLCHSLLSSPSQRRFSWLLQINGPQLTLECCQSSAI